MASYNKTFKTNIVRMYYKDERSLRSLSNEFGMSTTTIQNWLKKYSEEYFKSLSADGTDLAEENLMLREELDAAQKEISFLKSAVAFYVGNGDRESANPV